jgi:hypothetical protein
MRSILQTFLLSGINFCSLAEARTINVDVLASWQRPTLSFIAEMSEYLSDQDDFQTSESKGLFWRFVDTLCIPETSDDLSNFSSKVELLSMAPRGAPGTRS